MGANDIVLRITGKADVKTAAMQAKRDLNGSFDPVSMLGGEAGGERMFKRFLRGGMLGLAVGVGWKIGSAMGKGLQEGVAYSDGPLKVAWTSMTDWFVGLFGEGSKDVAKNMEENIGRAIDNIARHNRAVARENQVVSKEGDAGAAAAKGARDNAQETNSAWRKVNMEKEDAVRQLFATQQDAEEKLQNKIQDGSDLIAKRKQEIKTFGAEADRQWKLQSDLMDSYDKVSGVGANPVEETLRVTKRKGLQEGIDQAEKEKQANRDKVTDSRAALELVTDTTKAQTDQLQALKEYHAIQVQRLINERAITLELDKQDRAAKIAGGAAEQKQRGVVARGESTAYSAAAAELENINRLLDEQQQKVTAIIDAEIAAGDDPTVTEGLDKKIKAEAAILVLLQQQAAAQKDVVAAAANQTFQDLIHRRLGASGRGTRGGIERTPEELGLGVPDGQGGFRPRELGDAGLGQRFADFSDRGQQAADKEKIRQGNADRRSLTNAAKEHDKEVSRRLMRGDKPDLIEKQLGHSRGAEAAKLLADMEKAGNAAAADQALQRVAWQAQIDSAKTLTDVQKNLVAPP